MAQKLGTNGTMNANALTADARALARRLEDTEQRRKGLTRIQARQDVARDLGVTPGTLDSIARGRLKDPFRLRGLIDRLRGAVVAELGREIERLEHERQLLLASGVDPRDAEVAEVAADLARARAARGLTL